MAAPNVKVQSWPGGQPHYQRCGPVRLCFPL